ncbi:small oligopeptide transporter, OPT family [Hortaea werneckii]|nr:small oligopeptide transporter, OPT family [Hortaea werneckii]KAI7349857.1 small oligopeptide transporter, OPT family [Hortaea werneckii]KAI7571746.1 small oligopeptide transporter, OPT family [Hortaea werneckii]KAI7603032.1 small oligopeptide transporter, OPT family [Hortaea werneckii]KAI7682137.1 small oligopeptide transporter, OPT family [Hortaea werneckii]
MNRLRRPWAPSRRDTDGVQLQTLNEDGNSKEQGGTGVPEKTGIQETIQPVDLEHGRMQELEVDMGHVLEDRKIEDVDSDTSPYPEVRAVVPETDDPDMPVNTLRMWVLGTIWTLIGAGVNQFFSLRYPAVHIVSIVAELLVFPMGVALAHILPICSVELPYFGTWRVNPDHHFNIKEHVVIVIMANVTIGFAGGADATGIIQAAIKFYGFELPAGFSVRANAIANGWRITRLKFFMIVLGGAFSWYWLPGGLFVALSYFTWICWIAPNNIVVNQLFGFQTGLGLSPITFDWSQIAYNTNPLLSPSWAALNVFAGFAFFFWIVVPGLYYTNTWFTAYLPMMTADVYDRTGAAYDVSKILSDTRTIDAAKYAEYSPPYLSATFAFVYGLSFAAITSVITHVYLWHGKDIWDAVRGRQPLDIHGRLMRAYKKVPWWWYVTILVIFTALSIVLAEIYQTQLPVYGVFLALIIPAVYMVPCGIIQGITNVDANQLNVLSEFIGGYLFAGKPLANMIFKILSEDVVSQGIFFAQDQKLGHYFKVAPRTVFFAQGFAVLLGSLTQAGVTIWMLGNIENVCSLDQADNFTCPNGRTVYSSSVIWGLIGINYSSWALTNLIFNYWIKNRFFPWWAKYNYIVAAAVDTGTALAGIIIFFAISYPGYSFPDWWGNNVYLNTADGRGDAWKPMPESGYFGFANGTWS